MWLQSCPPMNFWWPVFTARASPRADPLVGRPSGHPVGTPFLTPAATFHRPRTDASFQRKAGLRTGIIRPYSPRMRAYPRHEMVPSSVDPTPAISKPRTCCVLRNARCIFTKLSTSSRWKSGALRRTESTTTGAAHRSHRQRLHHLLVPRNHYRAPTDQALHHLTGQRPVSYGSPVAGPRST